MPRATRAAARAQEQAEEAAAVALPPTPTRERVPLGEISHNSVAVIEMVVHTGSEEKMPVVKGKKGKGGKKGKKGAKSKANDAPIEVLEDDDHSSHSDATDQARDLLLDNQASATPPPPLVDASLASPSHAAIEVAVQSISPEPEKALEAQPVSSTMSALMKENLVEEGVSAADSNAVIAPGPSSIQPTEESFVGRVRSRSPAKRISRIEDSVEALDALEDEIEKIGEAIPGSASELSSPNDTKKPSKKAPSTRNGRKPAAMPNQRNPLSASKKFLSSTTLKASTSGLGREKKDTGFKSSTFRPSTLNKRPSMATNNDAESSPKRSNFPSKRISSVNKAPFQPAKSTKPPTKSNFELPGEAVARRLKEQREERQKREERSLTNSSQPKAKIGQTRQPPEIRLTATARARLSLAKNSGPNPGKASITSSGSPKPGSKAASRLTESKELKKVRPIAVQPRAPISANTSVKRGSPAKSNDTSRQPSTSGQSGQSAEPNLMNQKTRGKEVFSRPKQMLKAKENEKKAKEEAAKKARLEAAERGRLASREWAEKQKARKIAATQAAKEVVPESEATAA